MPLPVRCFTALRPSFVSGHLTTTFGAIWDSSSPSLTMPSNSVATTSRLTSPGTIAQISSTSGRNGRFSLAMSDGLVVTPSTTPSATPSLISATFAVSRKIFMLDPLSRNSAPLYPNAGPGPHPGEHAWIADDPAHDVHRAGGPDLVAPARRGGAEEDAERLAGRPVAKVAEGHDLLRRLAAQPEADVEVD